jgi:hypothetical protein
LLEYALAKIASEEQRIRSIAAQRCKEPQLRYIDVL